MTELLDSTTESQRRRAGHRVAVLDRFDALVAAGHSAAVAEATAAAEGGIGRRTLRRWRRAVRHSPARSGSRLIALVPRTDHGRPPRSWGEAEHVWDMFVADWARPERPDTAACYRRAGQWAAARGITCPPLSRFRRRIQRLPAAERVRARDGALAVMDLVPAQTRTVAGLAPLDIVNGDGRRLDVIVHLPSGRAGRPVMWVWQDVRTRRLLGYRLGETESADLVRLTLADLIRDHGVPGCVVVDQTRAAANHWLTGAQPGRKRWRSSTEELPGILAQLGIRYIATAVDRDVAGRGRGRGRSKPIERAFDDLRRAVDTHPAMAGAATGRSPSDRPETHRTRPAQWETLTAVVAAAFAAHNAREGRRTEAAAGRSFDECWAAEMEILTTPVRRLGPRQLAILLLAAEESRVMRDGTLRLRVGRGAHAPNRYHAPELIEHAGEMVVVRFDPAALHDPVHVYDRRGRWLAEAACVLPVGFASSDDARAHARARRAMRRGAEQSLAARRTMDALEAGQAHLAVAATAPASPPPCAPVVGLVTDTGVEIPAAGHGGPPHPGGAAGAGRSPTTLGALVALAVEHEEE